MVTVPLACEIAENFLDDILAELLVIGLIVSVAEHFVARRKAKLSVSLVKIYFVLEELL